MTTPSQKTQSNVNLTFMIDQIFSEEPQTAHFYHLDLESTNENEQSTSTDLSESSEKIRSQNTANVLMTIFFNGCKKLYGENFGINNLTKEQFDHANKYIQSFGYNTLYEYQLNEEKVPVSLQVWFEKLQV
jgi:hypothetical protein